MMPDASNTLVQIRERPVAGWPFVRTRRGSATRSDGHPDESPEPRGVSSAAALQPIDQDIRGKETFK
jgi:hypothetical protein